MKLSFQSWVLRNFPGVLAKVDSPRRQVKELRTAVARAHNTTFYRKRLKEAGNPVRYENFPGGHVMPTVDLMEEAVRWMDDQAVERKLAKNAAKYLSKAGM